MAELKSNVVPSEQRDRKQEDEHIAAVNAEGRKIYDDFLQREKNDASFKALDPQSKYEYYFKIHPDFARSNPIILRYITLGLFHEKAVYLYYQQCYRLTTRNDEDFCERQADYIKFLYKFTTNIRGAALDKVWQETKDHLMKEVDNFAAEREKIKAERLSRMTASDTIRRDALKASILRTISDAKAKHAAESNSTPNFDTFMAATSPHHLAKNESGGSAESNAENDEVD